MNIYVGNIAREATEEELKKEFEAFGPVKSITLIKDKFSGEPRGFGFIEMESNEQAQAAITGMNGKEFKEKNLKVNEAKPRTEERR